MTLALLLALALTLAPADTTDGPAVSPDPARQVVTRAEIEAAGLYRLPDLFRLIDGSRTATVDGFTWRGGLLGGDPFGAETWTLLVDSERVDFGLFGEQNLSLVPVAITQVDSVEVWTGPRVVAGTFAHGGILHIHTNSAERGVAARGGFGIGNEVGDPGPYRYVPELTSQNVDKFGADYEALASAGGAAVRGQARFKLLRFYATDTVAAARNRTALGGDNPALRLFAPALRVEADVLGGTHALSLLGGGSNDLWFFQPYGREIPVRRLYGQAGLHGVVPLASRLGLGYRVTYAENRLNEWDRSAFGLDPRWRERRVRAGLEGRWAVGPSSMVLGAEAGRVDAHGAEGFTVGTLTGTVACTATRWHYYTDFAFATAGDGVAASAAFGVRYALGPRLTLGAAAAQTERLPEEAGRFGFWQARGYDAFNPRVRIERAGAFQKTTKRSLRVDAAVRVSAAVTAEAEAAVRRFDGLALETQPVAADPAAGPEVERLTVVVPDVEGTAVRGRASVRAAAGRWRARAFYDGQTALGGDAAFEWAWEAVPTHRGGLEAAVSPDAGFTLSGSLVYRSGAHWAAYADPLDRAFGPDVPAVWLLDAAAEKWLWQRRLRMSLLFRNLLNQEERYHPVGAPLDLRFYLRLELTLGA